MKIYRFEGNGILQLVRAYSREDAQQLSLEHMRILSDPLERSQWVAAVLDANNWREITLVGNPGILLTIDLFA